jgi:hypothetical protein
MSSWVFVESGIIPEPKPHTITRMDWICSNISNYQRNVLNPTVMEYCENQVNTYYNYQINYTALQAKHYD